MPRGYTTKLASLFRGQVKTKPKLQRSKPKYVYFQASTLLGDKIEQCGNCSKAAEWEILWTHDPEEDKDLDWDYVCTQCLNQKIFDLER